VELMDTPETANAVAALPGDLQAAVLDHAPPLYLAGPDGRIAYANAGYRRLASQLDGEDVARIPAATELLAAHGAGEPLKRDHRIIADDKVRSYEATYEALTDEHGQLRAVVARFTQRDEVRQLNAALGLAHDRLDDISRLVSDWI
jgi:PAS domain-containing protein